MNCDPRRRPADACSRPGVSGCCPAKQGVWPRQDQTIYRTTICYRPWFLSPSNQPLEVVHGDLVTDLSALTYHSRRNFSGYRVFAVLITRLSCYILLNRLCVMCHETDFSSPTTGRQSSGPFQSWIVGGVPPKVYSSRDACTGGACGEFRASS